MTLSKLGAHTDGGLITIGQDNKQDTSNDLDNLISDSQNQTTTFSVAAGGSFSLATPQANLDLYLDSGLIRLVGAPGAAFTLDLPDGDRRVSFRNESGQACTIDTVGGATPTVALPTGAGKMLHVYGAEIEIVADDATETGALLADGSNPATGHFTWQDFEIIRAKLKDYSESQVTSTPSGSVTLNLNNANVFELEMDQDTTLIFSNPPASGNAGSFTLVLKQDSTGGWTVTFPASVDWEAGSQPTLSDAANLIDIMSFLTIDGGTTWFAFLGGRNFG